MWVIRVVLYNDIREVEVSVQSYAVGVQAIDAAYLEFPGQIARAEILPPVQQSRYAA